LSRSAEDDDVTRRTRLAAERTWLAWWRSGVAAAAAAVGVGSVVPELVGGSRTPYVVLGVGYAALSAGIFVGSAVRQVRVERALDRGEYRQVSEWGVIVLTLVASALALGTLAIIVVQP
jgi:putative membrane protein